MPPILNNLEGIMAQKLEYKILNSATEDQLNKYATGGWKLVFTGLANPPKRVLWAVMEKPAP